jgi:hypothetical protein
MDVNLFSSLAFVVSLPIVGWICGALFYDVGYSSRLGGLLAVSWFVLAVGALLFWHPIWKPFLSLLLLFGLVLWLWSSQQPSHERMWAAGFAKLPSMDLKGDTLTVENIRNTEYRTREDSTVNYECRTYHLSEMRGVDALVAFWGSERMCHPMFVFDFGPDGRICFSVEVRYRVGQQYNLLRSLYRQQELMYVVCDERDAILLRTKYRTGEDVYLYRLYVDALNMRSFFFEYANSINSLAEHARWYNGLTTNCTTSIYGQSRGRMQWDWRMLFNGTLDRLMYDRELLSQAIPFETLKKQSRVNEIANRAPADGFGDYIRLNLPGYRAETKPGSEQSDLHKG